MKRIFKLIVTYQDSITFTISCICFTSMMAGLILLGATTASDVDNRLNALTNTFDPMHPTNGLVLPEVWITNYATTNLTNYWLETEKEIKQWEYNTTKWVGKIVTADDSDRYTPRGIGWLKDCELGLRSDGMVVWREKK